MNLEEADKNNGGFLFSLLFCRRNASLLSWDVISRLFLLGFNWVWSFMYKSESYHSICMLWIDKCQKSLHTGFTICWTAQLCHDLRILAVWMAGCSGASCCRSWTLSSHLCDFHQNLNHQFQSWQQPLLLCLSDNFSPVLFTFNAILCCLGFIHSIYIIFFLRIP
jgi:hypothetical protein